MVRVILAPGVEHWSNHRLSNDPEFFGISAGQTKETSMEIVALSMGRLVIIPDEPLAVPPEEPHEAQSEEQP